MTINREKSILAAVFLFCLALRLSLLTQKNLWFDELFSWSLTLGSFYEILVRTSNDIHPPLYYFVLKVWNALLSDSVFSMRLLSVLFSSFSLFFIYPVTRRVMDIKSSMIVLILYSLSPLNVHYAQEVRMASMNLFLNLGSVYYFFLVLEPGITGRALWRKGSTYAYIVFTAGALYTHYFSFFILLSQLFILIYIYRRKISYIKGIIPVYASIFLLYFLWTGALYTQLMRGQKWRQPQSFQAALWEVVNYLKDMSLGLYYHYTDLFIVDILTILIFLILLLCLAGIIKKGLDNAPKGPMNYVFMLFCLVIIPLAVSFLVSFRQKIEFYRYLSILVPFILICAVYSINRLRSGFISVSALVVYTFINLYGLNAYYNSNFKNDNYREIFMALSAEHIEGGRIYVEPHYYGWIIDYYSRHGVEGLPRVVDNRYGFEQLLDSIFTQKPDSFWLLIDYSSVDTTGYSEKIDRVGRSFEKIYELEFRVIPNRVRLLRFGLKTQQHTKLF